MGTSPTDTTRAVLLGVVALVLVVVALPVVVMLVMMPSMMAGFGGVVGMMGLGRLVPWPAWVILGVWLLGGIGVILPLVRGIRRVLLTIICDRTMIINRMTIRCIR